MWYLKSNIIINSTCEYFTITCSNIYYYNKIIKINNTAIFYYNTIIL